MKELSLLGRHDKKDGEIEKAEQQIAALTSDNQALKDNLKSLQDKHEKVSLRYNSL
jgi:predicted nuclease with TOPRIM domain